MYLWFNYKSKWVKWKYCKITYVRDGSNYDTEILPTKTNDNEYKLGLWVRDAASGVGTISFYDPNTGEFGALGHGILDIDTEELIDIARGDIVTSKIVSIVKEKKASPVNYKEV